MLQSGAECPGDSGILSPARLVLRHCCRIALDSAGDRATGNLDALLSRTGPFRAHEEPKGRILRMQPLDFFTPRAGLEPATIRLTAVSESRLMPTRSDLLQKTRRVFAAFVREPARRFVLRWEEFTDRRRTLTLLTRVSGLGRAGLLLQHDHGNLALSLLLVLAIGRSHLRHLLPELLTLFARCHTRADGEVLPTCTSAVGLASRF
jgi:hypothetical protein